MSNRFSLRCAVFLILIKDDKILLSRRFNTGHEDGNYSLIAGHLDGNESATIALSRESLEEAGIEVNPNDLNLVHTMHDLVDGVEYINLFFKTDTWKENPTILEPDKCDDLSWFPFDHLPKNTINYIKQAIENIKDKEIYSEFGF